MYQTSFTMRKLFIFLIILTIAAANLQAQSFKNPLSQDNYTQWNYLSDKKVSHTGNIISYQINTPENNSEIIIQKTNGDLVYRQERGEKISVNYDETFSFIVVTPDKDTIKELKRKDVKKEDLPHDSLFILNLKTKSISKHPHIKSFYCPDKGGEWISIHFEEIPAIPDTLTNDTINAEAKPKKKPKRDKSIPKCTTFLALNPLSSDSIMIDNASDYAMDRYGNRIVTTGNTGDSIVTSFIISIDMKQKNRDTLFSKTGIIKNLNIDDKGTVCAFAFTADTAKEKRYTSYLLPLNTKAEIIAIDSLTPGMKSHWQTNIHHQGYSSEDGTRYYLYTHAIPEPAPEDTLLDEEKCSVDIWNWKDPLLQTQQLNDVKTEKNRGYLALFNLETKKFLQLADSILPSVSVSKKQPGNILLASTPLPYQQLISWDSWYSDYYIFNTNSGEKERILTKQGAHTSLSPAEKYILFWNQDDSTWNTYNIENKQYHNLTAGLDINFYNEIHDTPQQPSPYRVVGWTAKDKNVIVSDFYDLWILDPTNSKEPVNLTNSYGRDNNIRFRAIKLNSEKREISFDQNELILRGFNTKTKSTAFYKINKGSNPELLIEEDAVLGFPQKAKDTETLIWTKETFRDFPDIYCSDLNFNNIRKISTANPQQGNYLWGDVRMVSWTGSNGKKLDGLLYTPENMDPDKKYPMLVYFYERNSDNLHQHRIPSPSRSIINPAYCTSNGYVVFVPDIVYGTGHPGKDCYDAVVSGTLAMCDQYEFIDRDKIGLQGQSWGGYQIAWLVTQTDLYTCAMAGAPVSNMTSAYGGIRWGSGMSRAFQYEKSQSRIGQPLWDAPELYIENSPVFFADQVNTPLLIMHNDNDGAVPWYQGIEYFSALRRLQKPVWMLVYNGAPHNLRRWPDRMDLDKRMMQFFDHYLKDEPAPVWMSEGIPAVKKGIEKGFETK